MGQTMKINMLVKRMVAAVLAVAMLLAGMSGSCMEVQAASTTAYSILSSTKYAKVYTLSATGITIPYTTKYLNVRGTETYGRSNSSYIANSSDELYLMQVGYTNGKYWAKVQYPVGSRRVAAYIPLSAITGNNGSHVKSTSTGKFYCYQRKTSGSTNSSYYVAKGDTVYLIATSGSKYQILYPISNGKYRIAWCNKSDYDKYCSTSGKAKNTAAVSLNVPNYKQNDSRWKNTYIGNKTIGSIGCLVTALSMKYSYQTKTTTYPNAMKSKLSFSNNDVIWSSVTRLGYTRIAYSSAITNSIMSKIYTQLKAGKPVIIGGRSSSGGTHWVVITGYNGNSVSAFNSGNFTINDPASSSRTTLAQFLSSYPTVIGLVY